MRLNVILLGTSITTMLVIGASGAKADLLLTTGVAYTARGQGIQGNGAYSTPFVFNGSGLITGIAGGALNLQVTVVPDPSVTQSEWVVFRYTTANGQQLADPSTFFVGIDTSGFVGNVPLYEIGQSYAFLDPAGQFMPSQTNHSIFGQSIFVNSPVPGELGPTEGGVGSIVIVDTNTEIGFLSQPYSALATDNGLDLNQIVGFEEAIWLRPQQPITDVTGDGGSGSGGGGTGDGTGGNVDPVPEPMSLALLGIGLTGLVTVKYMSRKS